MKKYLTIMFLFAWGLFACSVSDEDFLNAAVDGQKDKVKSMIEKGANIHARDQFGQTVLFMMAGYEDIVELLMKKGADTKVLTKTGRSMIHKAAYHGNPKSIQMFIDAGVDINLVEGSVRTLGLISDGEQVRRMTESGRTALEIAIEKGNREAVKVILDHGGIINPARKRYGWTALHLAAEKGHKGVAELLLSRGANVNAQWHKGQTPLNRAKNKEIKKLLMKHGAKDIYVKLHKEFIEAVRKGDYAKVLGYIKQGVNVNARDGYFGTALHYISGLFNAEKMAKLLIDNGADVNLRNESGETPLLKAASSWKGGISKVLLANGARINDRDWKGRTALHIASYSTQIEGAKLFIGAGADVNARDNSGQTPLHLAVKPGSIMTSETKKGEKIFWQEECIKLLLSHGAKLDIKDKKGRTAMDLAKKEQVKAWLKQYARGK